MEFLGLGSHVGRANKDVQNIVPFGVPGADLFNPFEPVRFCVPRLELNEMRWDTFEVFFNVKTTGEEEQHLPNIHGSW